YARERWDADEYWHWRQRDDSACPRDARCGRRAADSGGGERPAGTGDADFGRRSPQPPDRPRRLVAFTNITRHVEPIPQPRAGVVRNPIWRRLMVNLARAGE